MKPTVSAELLRELADLPADPPRSRLAPFKAIILRWRREGWTYRKIAATLRERAGVTIAHQNVRAYVQRHARPRQPQEALTGLLENRGAEPGGPRTAQSNCEPRHSPEEIAAWRRAAQAARSAAPQIPEPPKKRFFFDETKPITKGD
jgi:hypothetical protein